MLKEQGIHTQAYDGRSFVGSHCHKYLKTPAYENICESVVRKTVEITNNSDCHAMANDICRDFKTLNSLYAVVHAQRSHTQPLAEKGGDTEDMQNSIDKYMTFFRRRFPGTRISPKQHILEMHCVDFMQSTWLGLGLLGEQGGEEAHALINSIKRRAWGLRSQTDRLMLLMHEHMAHGSCVTCPTVASQTDAKKEKKEE